MPYVLLLLVVLLLWECSALLQIGNAAWRFVFVSVGGVMFFAVTTMTEETFLSTFQYAFVFNLYTLPIVWFCCWFALSNSMNESRDAKSNSGVTTAAPALSVKISSLSKTAKFTLTIGCLVVLTALCVAFYGLHEYVGPGVLLYVLVVAWATDTGAYFVGRSFGKRSLSRRISPKKTVEGTIGGFLLGVILALILGYLWIQPELLWPNYGVVMAAILIPFLAVGGDLIESVLKRISDAKDSGSILPGHGGLLDRIDSLVLAAPFMFVISLLFGNSST